MYFVTLAKSRSRLKREHVEKIDSLFGAQKDVKVVSFYWTLGRYDAVIVTEAPNEQAVLQLLVKVGDFMETETMVGVETLPSEVL